MPRELVFGAGIAGVDLGEQGCLFVLIYSKKQATRQDKAVKQRSLALPLRVFKQWNRTTSKYLFL